ncbi:MAG: DMT family protein [Chitinophagaceae bacterium]|nr:DMT family protein [Chitinophagaceae bacterium]
MNTILLLIASNIFMTFAWYFHLKQEGWPLWKAVLVSWVIALFEYILMVPANRMGYNKGMSGFQLKMTQEVITLVVFGFFAVLYLKEPFHWRYLVSFAFLMGAVYFMFGFKSGA